METRDTKPRRFFFARRCQLFDHVTQNRRNMYTVFSGVKGVLKCKKLHIDQCVFRLHYKVSFFLLIASCALVGSKQYAGEPIKCAFDGTDYSTLIEIYCFITSTYTINSAVNKTIEDGAPHPGVYFSQKKEEYRYHTYYQWVGFLLFLQAIMFYIPHWLWKCFEGGELMKLLEKEEGTSKDPEVMRLRHRNKIVNCLRNRWKEERLYCYKYFFCEFLCLINVIGQMLLLDKIFNDDYLFYGIEAIKYFRYGSGVVQNPFDRVFPRITSCTFPQFGRTGKIRKKSVICVLAVNTINEKVFLFLWFWFVILICITLFAFTYKLILFSFRHLRFSLLKFSFRTVNDKHFRFIVKNGNAGDYLFIYLLGQNMDQSLFNDVIIELVSRYEQKEC